MMQTINFISFTKLSIDDLKIVLNLRNLPHIKEQMVNDKDILLCDHLSFCEELKGRDDKLYFAIKYANSIVGVINFNGINPIRGGAIE